MHSFGFLRYSPHALQRFLPYQVHTGCQKALTELQHKNFITLSSSVFEVPILGYS